MTKSFTSIVGRQHPVGNSKSFASSASVNSNPTKHVSLADQYLDTMIMNDLWRAICLRIILQSQRKRQVFQRPRPTSIKPHDNPSAATVMHSNTRSIRQGKSKIGSSTSPTNSNKADSSSSNLESDFNSDLPAPHSEITGPARSTRSQFTTGFDGTISIDSLASTSGRCCLSCKSTNTTCWRKVSGGVVCNSCGLR
jgi:hypothetical protein